MLLIYFHETEEVYKGFFYYLKKVFKMDQHVFELVTRLANLLNSLGKYLCLEFSIYICNWFCRTLSFFKRNTSIHIKNTSILKQQWQYDLLTEVFSLIRFLISLFIQAGSLPSQTNLARRMKLWIILITVLLK